MGHLSFDSSNGLYLFVLNVYLAKLFLNDSRKLARGSQMSNWSFFPFNVFYCFPVLGGVLGLFFCVCGGGWAWVCVLEVGV